MDIHDGARPDEQFHVQVGQPQLVDYFDYKVIRRAAWQLVDGWFTSWWFLGHLQFYHGTMKCDGSRTRWAWAVGLTQPNEYVITTTPKELLSLRWRTTGPGEAVWDNMGGS